MGDLISREALFRAWDNLADDFTDVDDYIDEMIRLAQDAPAVDAALVVHGRWIYHVNDLFPAESTQECSVCHEEEYITLRHENFCPNCDAKMDGREV